MEKITKILTISILGILVLSGIQGIATTKKIVTMDNHPPEAPQITGPTATPPGPHEWTFKAVDPDGDNLSYEIDWGDDVVEKLIGPYTSGEEVTLSHTYWSKGTARIGARANDTHGAIGDWGYLNVVISENAQLVNLPFLQFMGRYLERYLVLDWIFLLFQIFTSY